MVFNINGLIGQNLTSKAKWWVLIMACKWDASFRCICMLSAHTSKSNSTLGYFQWYVPRAKVIRNSFHLLQPFLESLGHRLLVLDEAGEVGAQVERLGFWSRRDPASFRSSVHFRPRPEPEPRNPRLWRLEVVERVGEVDDHHLRGFTQKLRTHKKIKLSISFGLKIGVTWRHCGKILFFRPINYYFRRKNWIPLIPGNCTYSLNQLK